MQTQQQRFDGPSLEAVLAEVEARVGPSARITSAQKVRQGGVGGFFSKERYEVVVDVEEGATISTTESKYEAARSILDLAEEVNAVELGDSSTISTESASFADVLERIASQADAARGSASLPASVNVRSSDPSPLAEASLALSPAVKDALLSRGLPASYLPDPQTGADLFEAVMKSLRALPSAPPLRTNRGGIIAIVGERYRAEDLADSFAEQLGNEHAEIVIAGPVADGVAEIITAADADEARRRWRRREVPTIVVIDSPPLATSSAWAEEVLAALEPSATWIVAEASRKREDVAAWLDALGGVDAIALDDIGSTVSPASILELGIPVGRLDGRRASAALWASILTDGLEG